MRLRGHTPGSRTGAYSCRQSPSALVPRTSRLELAGALHHVIAKSPSGRFLFNDDEERHRYLRMLAREIRERRWQLLTFCLLSNHLHLVIATPDTDLGAGFKRLHEDYARYVNERRAEGGHLFGDRFYNRLVMTERHLFACFRYVAHNPVAAGICNRPRDWPWSAHRALAGLADPPPFLDVAAAYAYFDAEPDEARIQYSRLVARSNVALLEDLRTGGATDWLIAAHKEFSIPVDEIAAYLGVSRATAYRRLVTARETVGTVPPFSFETAGTVP
jgi:REP element-mobilizing transposase RayT